MTPTLLAYAAAHPEAHPAPRRSVSRAGLPAVLGTTSPTARWVAARLGMETAPASHALHMAVLGGHAERARMGGGFRYWRTT